jgi:hypothetical protein
MFENLYDYPVDPIMIGADYFAQDPRDDKLNLTVGVYQDEYGNTPILQAVKEAERILVETQVSKSYLALTGDTEYCNCGANIWGRCSVARHGRSGGAIARVTNRLAADTDLWKLHSHSNCSRGKISEHPILRSHSIPDHLRADVGTPETRESR